MPLFVLPMTDSPNPDFEPVEGPEAVPAADGRDYGGSGLGMV